MTVFEQSQQSDEKLEHLIERVFEVAQFVAISDDFKKIADKAYSSLQHHSKDGSLYSDYQANERKHRK